MIYKWFPGFRCELRRLKDLKRLGNAFEFKEFKELFWKRFVKRFSRSDFELQKHPNLNHDALKVLPDAILTDSSIHVF